MRVERELSKIIKKTNQSVLVLGPRQTGKTTLFQSLQPDLTINLAHEPTFLEFASDPNALEKRIRQVAPRTICLDEVQRLPSLLNTIQVLIDESREKKKDLRFFLTGSSARKLRRGKANLLPGRVLSLALSPLVSAELGDRFDVDKALSIGTLPGIYLSDNEFDRQAILSSYAATYLKEEVQAEALTKDLEGFARFLRYCAASAGQYLDLSKLAAAAQVKRASAIRFFEILEDTLIATRCDAFAKSERRRLVQHPRYFFFDNGALNGVLGNFKVSEDRRGGLFEHLVYAQILHTANALGQMIRISNYRTEHGAELDFILEFPDGQTIAVECKAGVSIGKGDFGGFESFAEFFGRPHKKMVVYGGRSAKRVGDFAILPLDLALQSIFTPN